MCGEVLNPTESAVHRKLYWKEACILWKEDIKL